MLVFEAEPGRGRLAGQRQLLEGDQKPCLGNELRTGSDPVGGGVPVELVDARKLPVGWQGAGFDDGAWQTAQVLRAIHIGGFARSQPPTDPYGPLYPRPIAQLGGAVVAPVSVKAESLQGAVDTAKAGPGGPRGRQHEPARQPAAERAGCR